MLRHTIWSLHTRINKVNQPIAARFKQRNCAGYQLCFSILKRAYSRSLGLLAIVLGRSCGRNPTANRRPGFFRRISIQPLIQVHADPVREVFNSESVKLVLFVHEIGLPYCLHVAHPHPLQSSDAKNPAHFKSIVVVFVSVPETRTHPIIVEINKLDLKLHLRERNGESRVAQNQQTSFYLIGSVRLWKHGSLLV